MSQESRNRMISFRLTGEEYEKFRHLTVSRGLGTISDLIRNALNQLIAESRDDFSTPVPEMYHRVATLESRLADLASAVAQMETRLSLTSTPPPTGDALKFAQTANSQ